jgi:hypothetical protein
MKLEHSSRTRLATWLAASLLGAAGLCPAIATASMVADPGNNGAFTLQAASQTITTTLYDDLVAYDGVSFTRLELPMPGAGSLHVELADLGFPESAATLSFALVNGSTVLGVINGTGTLSYDVGGPLALFGYVYAVASPATNAGAYALTIEHVAVAPVPLPPALGLLLGGLGLAGAIGRRRREAPMAAR